MYHTDDAKYSTSLEDWSERFKNIMLQVSVLFHENRGLLNCETNTNAIHQIQDALNSLGSNLESAKKCSLQ